jgi:hypothetical protein
MTLSVLSALARLGVDHWEETAALASMPRDKARQRLAALIATTTKALANALSSEIVAARLIALLPVASKLKISLPPPIVKATSFRSLVVPCRRLPGPIGAARSDLPISQAPHRQTPTLAGNC